MTDHTARILLVSNRLPVKVRLERQRVVLETTVGGLATGLSGPHSASGGLWIGWPGDVSRLDQSQRGALDEQLARERFVPVHLSPSEIDRYYEGFCNSIVWPLFHYMPDRMPLASRDWGAYVDANTRFADAVAAVWQPGDRIWVHDYHLLLLPAMLRERLPEARIGLFLHIPFPSSDVFRVLPWRSEILRGMLGADLIGFHTHGDLQNFLTASLRVLGVEAEVDRFEWGGRMVRAGVHPIGIDFAAFADVEAPAKLAAEIAALRGKGALVLGVDRLDYTKGIPRRLLAFERLLEANPRWRGRVKMVQVAVPSREGVAAYRELHKQVDELVGRINGEWSTLGWSPIHLLHRGFRPDEVVAMYRAADVMLVTPVRDGMNLVAKEFVAARADEDGVLVLSEFAGAAAELGEALVVNPHDLDAVAEAIEHGLSMPREERRARMQALRARVRTSDIHAWADGFLEALSGVPERPPTPRLLPGAQTTLLTSLASEAELLLLLDHDGTLVELTPKPAEAVPDEELLRLLAGLAAAPGTTVHIVSGRDRHSLSRWYGELDVHLHAEHGAASRVPGSDWLGAGLTLGVWREPLIERMQTFAARTAGAFVEEKNVAVAWHYRRADAEFGAAMARELRHHLRAFLASAPVEVIAGNKVIEVRPAGVNKGRVAAATVAAAPPGIRAVAIGDDRTDADMFAALPETAVTIAVGDRVAQASWRLPDVTAVRRLLADLLDRRAKR